MQMIILTKTHFSIYTMTLKRSKKIALTFSDYFTVDVNGKILKFDRRHDFSRKKLLLDQNMLTELAP